MAARAKTFLLCHGAWSGGWSWKKMHPLMAQAGHRLVAPTYTGLGERSHLASPAVDLETHIQDILNVITVRGSQRHRAARPQLWRHGRHRRCRSRARARDAIDLSRRLRAARWPIAVRSQRGRARADAQGGGRCRRLPHPAEPAAAGYAASRSRLAQRAPHQHAAQMFRDEAEARHGEPAMPRSYIYCKRIPPGDVFGQFARRTKSEEGWRYFELDASHAPNVTAPEALMGVLQEIVA